jgi:hypothetical protein
VVLGARVQQEMELLVLILFLTQLLQMVADLVLAPQAAVLLLVEQVAQVVVQQMVEQLVLQTKEILAEQLVTVLLVVLIAQAVAVAVVLVKQVKHLTAVTD